MYTSYHRHHREESVFGGDVGSSSYDDKLFWLSQDLTKKKVLPECSNSLLKLGNVLYMYTLIKKDDSDVSDSEEENPKRRKRGKFLRYSGKEKLESIKIDKRVGEVGSVSSTGRVLLV